jgi:hypothetical protein
MFPYPPPLSDFEDVIKYRRRLHSLLQQLDILHLNFSPELPPGGTQSHTPPAKQIKGTVS